MTTSLKIWKKKAGLIICNSISTIGAKIVKIGPADTEIALHIGKKLENAWQSLAYSPLGTVCHPLANTCEKHLLSDHLSA